MESIVVAIIETIRQGFGFLFDAISTIYNTIVVVIQWLLWFFVGLFNGDVFDLLGRLIRNMGVSAMSSFFGLFPSSDTSVFAPYCGALNWLVPVDYAVGCIAVIVTAIGLKMLSGWILRWLW